VIESATRALGRGSGVCSPPHAQRPSPGIRSHRIRPRLRLGMAGDAAGRQDGDARFSSRHRAL